MISKPLGFLVLTRKKISMFIDVLVHNVPFLYPLKTCFPGVEKGCTGNKWVNVKETISF